MIHDTVLAVTIYHVSLSHSFLQVPSQQRFIYPKVSLKAFFSGLPNFLVKVSAQVVMSIEKTAATLNEGSIKM
jgi:hypothetical protein